MKKVIHPLYKTQQDKLDFFIAHFNTEGEDYGNQDRNSLKLFNLDGVTVNVKSFKVPNFINKIAYRFFKKSKAQRSFEYANKLQKLGIGTPQPIAYYENPTALVFKSSYYLSAHLDCNYTYRDLTFNFNIPNYETILRAFTRFTYTLHENNVNFLDHSPGNTLIKIENDTIDFYLVDLNRMRFETMSFEARIKNFAKLTTHKQMVEIMSDEYAKCINADYTKVFNLMWGYTEDFQMRYHRRRKLKKKVLFWRS